MGQIVRTSWGCWAGRSCPCALSRDRNTWSQNLVLEARQVKAGVFRTRQGESRNEIWCLVAAVAWWKEEMWTLSAFTHLSSPSPKLCDWGEAATSLCLGFPGGSSGLWATQGLLAVGCWAFLGSDKSALANILDLPGVSWRLMCATDSGSVLFLSPGKVAPERGGGEFVVIAVKGVDCSEGWGLWLFFCSVRLFFLPPCEHFWALLWEVTVDEWPLP